MPFRSHLLKDKTLRVDKVPMIPRKSVDSEVPSRNNSSRLVKLQNSIKR